MLLYVENHTCIIVSSTDLTKTTQCKFKPYLLVMMGFVYLSRYFLLVLYLEISQAFWIQILQFQAIFPQTVPLINFQKYPHPFIIIVKLRPFFDVFFVKVQLTFFINFCLQVTYKLFFGLFINVAFLPDGLELALKEKIVNNKAPVDPKIVCYKN